MFNEENNKSSDGYQYLIEKGNKWRSINFPNATFDNRELVGVECRKRYYAHIVAAIFGISFGFLLMWILLSIIFPVDCTSGVKGMLMRHEAAWIAIPVFVAIFVSSAFIIAVRLVDMLSKPYMLRVYVKGASPYTVYGNKKIISRWHDELKREVMGYQPHL